MSSVYDEVDPADPDQTIAVPVETLTDANGQFVLFFKSLPAATQTIQVTATKNGDQVQDQIDIVEGTTQTLNLPPLP